MSKTQLGLQSVLAPFEAIRIVSLFLFWLFWFTAPNTRAPCSKHRHDFCLRVTYTRIKKSGVCSLRCWNLSRQETLRSSAGIWVYPHPSRMLSRQGDELRDEVPPGIRRCPLWVPLRNPGTLRLGIHQLQRCFPMSQWGEKETFALPSVLYLGSLW